MNISITRSVGRGGGNLKSDTRKIQRALNRVLPGTPLGVDGDCGPKTIRRIEAFQRRFMPSPDGRIDPGGRSLARLNAELAVPPVNKAATKKAATKKAATKKAATKKAATGKAAAGAAVKAAASAVKKAGAKKAAPRTSRSRSAPIELNGSVGRGGANHAVDVRLIQQALNEVLPDAPLEVDGDCGSRTIAGIERFQRGFMRKPDGRVDPGGTTLKRLTGAAPSMRGAWKGDSARWSESKKLDSLDSGLRSKIERVLAGLRTEGFKPKIVYAWRSVEVQQQLVAQGHSKVRFSFHNAQYRNGRPRAYAADIIDRRWAWSDAAMENGFWAALGRIAKGEGLYWGGDWRSFKDWAHVQSFPNTRLREIKRQSGVA